MSVVNSTRTLVGLGPYPTATGSVEVPREVTGSLRSSRDTDGGLGFPPTHGEMCHGPEGRPSSTVVSPSPDSRLRSVWESDVTDGRRDCG